MAGIADLRARAEASGRDPASISVTIFGAAAEPARLDAYRKAGVERVVFALPARAAMPCCRSRTGTRR